MNNEIEDIEYNDIEIFKNFLKLEPDYKQFELKENFVKFSRIYHPSIRDGEDDMFNRIVVAYEVLNYIYLNKKKNIISNLIEEWNKSEKEKVVKLLVNYKLVNLSNYLNIIGKSSVDFKIFKGVFSFILFYMIILLTLGFFTQAINGSLSFFGIFYIGLLVAGVIVRYIRY